MTMISPLVERANRFARNYQFIHTEVLSIKEAKIAHINEGQFDASASYRDEEKCFTEFENYLIENMRGNTLLPKAPDNAERNQQA